jgi:type II secretory pathway component GspD/PulD (secretin)
VKKLGPLLILSLFILLASTSFSAKLVNYTYLPGESEINFVFIYDDEPEEFDIQSLDYGRYIVVNTPGEMTDMNSINRFIGYSPIIGFKASSGKGQISYRFDMLLPREPEVEIVANTLRVTFKRNTEVIKEFSSFTDSTRTGDRPSIMALLSVLREYMDINLVIDEASLKGIQPVEFVMLSENLRAEDFFLQIVMNNPKIAYAFLPNNTVYVVRKELLPTKIEEILAETSLSPQQETSYWAAYNFRINKKSTLYEQFANLITTGETSSQRRFSVEGFKNYIQSNFETYTRAPAGTLNDDIITLAKGGDEDEEYVPVGLLLYGDNNRHERFGFFIRFLEGVSFSGDGESSEDGSQTEQTDYTQKISYAPLSQEEVREFMEFYLNFRTRVGVHKQEILPEYEELVYEILPLIDQIQITGPVNATKKITSYLTDYITNRKARGNEKIVEIKVKDGYGTVFAIALRRLFPKAIVDSEGINVNSLVNKPTFEWTYEDVKGFGAKDGNPDSVSIFGSNYEIQTSQKIADDWGWLVPPLSSEIRILTLSEEIPVNIVNGLKNPESPNSLQNKFPTIEIDYSFSPLMFVKGKTHELDLLEGYIKEIESVMLGDSDTYKIINMNTRFFEDPQLFSDLKGLVEAKFPKLEIISYPSLNSIFVKGEDSEEITKVVEEIQTLTNTTEYEEYSQYVDFERLANEDVNLVYEQLYKNKGIEMLYVESRDLYKIYGPDKAVKDFIEELKKMDARRPDEDDGTFDKTELVYITIPSLTPEEVAQLVNIKVPGVTIEPFEAGGYFITGNDEEIEKTKELINTMSTDFMEESLVLSLAPGITFQTIQNVLNLYYNVGEDMQLLDFENSKILIKGQKEKIQNIKLILNSFGLIGETDDNFEKVVKRITYPYIADTGKVPPQELMEIVNAYHPGVEIQYFSTAEIFLLIGSMNEVEKATQLINEYAEKIVVEKVWFGPVKENAYSSSEIMERLRQEIPEIKDIKADEEKREYTITGPKESVAKAVAMMNQLIEEGKGEVIPTVEFADDGVHFNVKAQGKDVLELTKEIAKGMAFEPKLFLPEDSSSITSRLEMEELTWQQWLKITERLYDFKVEVVEGLTKPIYVITPPGSEHETGMSKKRTLNISHGFAEVSSLISSAFGGEVYTDENNGLVIFTGVSDSQMVELKPLILNTVQPKKMVEIKAMVIDNKVLDNLNQSYGVSFSANSENGSFSLDNDGFSFDGSILSFTDYSNLLDLLTNKLSIGISTTGAQENSDDNSIIKPYITTLSGEQASINIGENYKYRIPTTDASGNVVEQILNVPIGNLLNIRPTVNQDDTITMEISVEISSLAGFSSDGLPNTNTRNVTSIVTVNDKDTIVMGGLQGESKNYSQEKLPFFGDLPIIGKLFTWEIENNDNRSVTIFITPRIIETKGKPMQVFGQNIE